MNKKNTSKTFSTKIDLTLKEKLKGDLKDQGFAFAQPEHTIFSAQKKGIVVTLYNSGSLVVQGSEKDDFIEFYLEPEILKSFDYTNPEINVDMTPRIGVDEAGKGDFFGPLCIAGCYADESGIKKLISQGVKDSKKLSDNTILKMAAEVKKSTQFSTIVLFPQKYNELYAKFHNLNYLLGWGHASVIYNLHEKTACKDVIIDQFADKHVVENAVKQKKIQINLTQRTKGESDIVVAAASILARAAFLDGIKKLEEETNLKLPKGASSLVFEAGVKVALKYGVEDLKKYVKVHFKTYDELLARLKNLQE